MKKLLHVFLVLFFITSCSQDNKTVIKKTNIVVQQQNGAVEKQGKVIVKQELREIVEKNSVIVIDVGC